MPEDYPDYPNHRQILEYIHTFANKYGLRKYIQFNKAVDQTSQQPDGSWEITTNCGEQFHCQYLICANGVTWIPNIVIWPGEVDGEIIHAVEYTNPESFRGKRVLVIGGGNSGVDIAADATFMSQQTFLSTRRGYHLLPKHIMGEPIDAFFSRFQSWPKRL